MTPETVTDPDLQEVAWDLSHLLDGERSGDERSARGSAVALGVTVGTVRSRINRARLMLKDRLKPHLNLEEDV